MIGVYSRSMAFLEKIALKMNTFLAYVRRYGLFVEIWGVYSVMMLCVF